jgi:hypothetical protein
MNEAYAILTAIVNRVGKSGGIIDFSPRLP